MTSSVTFRFLRELRMASVTSNCFPLSEQCKLFFVIKGVAYLTQVGASVLTLLVICIKLVTYCDTTVRTYRRMVTWVLYHGPEKLNKRPQINLIVLCARKQQLNYGERIEVELER